MAVRHALADPAAFGVILGPRFGAARESGVRVERDSADMNAGPPEAQVRLASLEPKGSAVLWYAAEAASTSACARRVLKEIHGRD